MTRPIPCARCGRENDASAGSCVACGEPLRAAPPPLPPTCGACGARLEAGFRFCGRCGAAAGVAPRTPAPPPLPGKPAARRQAPGRLEASAAAPRTPAPPTPVPPADDPPPTGHSVVRIATVRSDGLPGAMFDVREDETICGRSEGTIRLADDATVSPRHARFTVRHGVLTVEDLGSANGTFVRIRAPRRLEPGDELRVGRQLLRVEPIPAAPAASPDGGHPWGAPDPGHALRLAQLLDGGGVGDVFPLGEGQRTLGRAEADVTFPTDRYVSGRHARLEVARDAITITDAGSSNGTFVRISAPTELASGDQLLVGAQLLRVHA